jgi:hypothetical protein
MEDNLNCMFFIIYQWNHKDTHHNKAQLDGFFPLIIMDVLLIVLLIVL